MRQVQAAPPFLGLSVVVQAPFAPPAWPQSRPGEWRPAAAQGRFRGLDVVAVASPFVPQQWPAPRAAEPPRLAAQARFLGLDIVAVQPPFVPYVWPAPRVAAPRLGVFAPWFNPSAPGEVCPPILSTAVRGNAVLGAVVRVSAKLGASAVRGAMLDQAVSVGAKLGEQSATQGGSLSGGPKRC